MEEKKKRRKANLAMAWIDCRKVYVVVPHSWILETLELTGIALNIQRLVREGMVNWKTVLTKNWPNVRGSQNPARHFPG